MTPHNYTQSIRMLLYGRKAGYRQHAYKLFTASINPLFMLRKQHYSTDKQYYSTENKKVTWYPIPISLGLAWLATLHFMHMSKRQEEPSVTVQGPLFLRLYASLPLRGISRIWGYANGIDIPVPLRKPLFSLYGYLFSCSLDEMQDPDLTHYSNLGEFFYRALKPGCRDVSTTASLVSPADGKILHYGPVFEDRVEQVKGITYSLDALLGNNPFSDSAKKTHTYIPSKGNSLFSVVVYLAPGDYHRFHSPVEWNIARIRHFAGKIC